MLPQSFYDITPSFCKARSNSLQPVKVDPSPNLKHLGLDPDGVPQVKIYPGVPEVEAAVFAAVGATEKIGQGSYDTVFRGKHKKTGTVLAVKLSTDRGRSIGLP